LQDKNIDTNTDNNEVYAQKVLNNSTALHHAVTCLTFFLILTTTLLLAIFLAVDWIKIENCLKSNGLTLTQDGKKQFVKFILPIAFMGFMFAILSIYSVVPVAIKPDHIIGKNGNKSKLTNSIFVSIVTIVVCVLSIMLSFDNSGTGGSVFSINSSIINCTMLSPLYRLQPLFYMLLVIVMTLFVLSIFILSKKQNPNAIFAKHLDRPITPSKITQAYNNTNPKNTPTAKNNTSAKKQPTRQQVEYLVKYNRIKHYYKQKYIDKDTFDAKIQELNASMKNPTDTV